jgi:hypothetical protein
MKFRVKTFAQLMILSHQAALVFDDISEGKAMIDSYEIAENPERVNLKLQSLLMKTFDQVMKTEAVNTLYRKLYDANNDDLFFALLKERNENLRQGKLTM